MARNPFEFLKNLSQQNLLTHLLAAIIHKSGDELELTLDDLNTIEPGDSVWHFPTSNNTRLMLRFARKGAQAFFVEEAEPSERTRPSSLRNSASRMLTPDLSLIPPQPPGEHRAVVHSDLDLVLREEEMAQKAEAAAKRRQQEARAESGALPWRTVKPQ